MMRMNNRGPRRDYRNGGGEEAGAPTTGPLDINLDPTTTKYVVRARIATEGVVEKPDVVGAVFGQTEGLLGDELDLRDLQKGGRIGRIEVTIDTQKGRSNGIVIIPSSLDQVETCILGAALETIDRVGPCKAKIEVEAVEDVRISKKNRIVDRAKELLNNLLIHSKTDAANLTDSVRQAVQVQEIISFGKDRLPAGPNIDTSDAILVVEGRSDVLNLLKQGIKNAIAVEGTNIPDTIKELSKDKVVTAFVDGDRGGELILKELLQVAEVEFITRAPSGMEVEELTQKQIMKALRHKIPAEQYIEQYGLEGIQRPKVDTGIPPPPPRETAAQPAAAPASDTSGSDQTAPPQQPQVSAIPLPGVPVPAPPPQPFQTQPGPDGAGSRESSFRSRFSALLSRGGAPKPPLKDRRLSPEQMKYRELLGKLAGSLKANVINSKGLVVKEVPVRELTDSIKAGEDLTAVVFDGVITQRILDLAAEAGVKTLVGAKLGAVTKQPANVEILTGEDME